MRFSLGTSAGGPNFLSGSKEKSDISPRERSKLLNAQAKHARDLPFHRLIVLVGWDVLTNPAVLVAIAGLTIWVVRT